MSSGESVSSGEGVNSGEGVQPSSPDEETQRALQLGHRALVEYRQGNYKRSLDLFEQAESLAHSPVFVLYQARAALRIGSWVQASALLARCSEERLSPQAPEAWHNAVREALTESILLDQRLPRLVLDFGASLSLPLRVRVGEQLRDWDSHDPLTMAVDPGAVEVSVVDALGRKQTFSVRAREHRTVQILVAGPVLADKAEQPGTSSAESRAVTPARSERRAAFAAWGVGGVGLAVGVGAFSAALSMAKNVKATCREFGDQCPESELPRASRAVQMANIATVGFVVAGVGAAAGIGLWVLSQKPHKQAFALGIRPDGLHWSMQF